MLTGSSIERADKCPASQVLPAVHSTNKYAEAGTVKHSFVNLISDGATKTEALAAMPEKYREQCNDLPVDKMSLHLASEVAFAFDVKTGKAREIGRNINRNYNAGPDEICCTVDIVGVGENSVLVKDFKGAHADVTHPRENHQLLFGGLCAARAYGKDTATLVVTRLIDDTVKNVTAQIDGWGLDVFASRLVGITQRVKEAKELVLNGKTPDVSEGKWCTYCPAFDSCPAKIGLLKAMIDGTEANKLENLLPLQLDLAPQVYQKWREMGVLYKRATSIVKAFASKHSIDLGDGKFYGEVISSAEKLDGDIAYGYLQEEFDQETADKATGRTVTKKALKEVARILKSRGEVKTIKDGEAALLERLHEKGAVTVVENKIIKEFKA